MKFSFTGNLGLKFLALVLAIVIYLALKNETHRNSQDHHDQSFFKTR